MKPAVRAASVLLLLLAGTAARADTLPLRHVVVTTSGLALYEYQGKVDGNATLDFPVRLDRVDDVLKSLVVLDDKGSPGGVFLPGREPLAQMFGGLPFAEADLSSEMQLLNTLRGAAVRVSGPDGDAEGRLLGVAEETAQVKGDQTVTRHRVTIETGSGALRSFVLENGTDVQFTDKTLQAQLDHALATVFDNGNKGQRTLHVAVHGDSDRPVGVSFIQQAPLWKTTYRLVLPANGDKSGQAVLQGWAILENTTGQDWQNVGVTLMTGAPVTYHQALYESYYPARNELPLKVMGLVLPKTDEGTVAAPAEETAASDTSDESAPAAAPAPMMMMQRNMAFKAAGMPMAVSAAASMAREPQMAQAPTATAAEAGSQLVFAFPQPITLPAGNSAMVPFINRTLPAEKIWVYQPASQPPIFHPMPMYRQGIVGGPIVAPEGRPGTPDHPYEAVAVKNDSASGLPPGILTLYSQSPNGLLFAGDADMPLVPKGEDRFVSFALDAKTNIDRESTDDRQLGLITIAKGVLNQKIVETNTTTYTLKAPPDEARTIVIEHPRRDNWALQKPDGLAAEPQMTSNAYRLRVALAAGQSKTVRVTLTQTANEAIALSSSSADDLDTRMEAAGDKLPANVRAALDKVKTLQQAVGTQQQVLEDISQRRQSIAADQARLRENIKTVSPDSAVGKRYLKTLDDQETQLDTLARNEQEARDKRQAAQKALDDYVGTLTL